MTDHEIELGPCQLDTYADSYTNTRAHTHLPPSLPPVSSPKMCAVSCVSHYVISCPGYEGGVQQEPHSETTEGHPGGQETHSSAAEPAQQGHRHTSGIHTYICSHTCTCICKQAHKNKHTLSPIDTHTHTNTLLLSLSHRYRHTLKGTAQLLPGLPPIYSRCVCFQDGSLSAWDGEGGGVGVADGEQTPSQVESGSNGTWTNNTVSQPGQLACLLSPPDAP